MTPKRNQRFTLIAGAVAVALSAAAGVAHADRQDLRHGSVFAMTNDVAHNEIVVYEAEQRGAHPGLRRLFARETSGQGSGAYLGSQSAITLSTDRQQLYTVNAGSNSVSLFEIGKRDLKLTATVPSGGLMPISVAEHEGLVYVLNHGNPGGLSGFREDDGKLVPIPGAQMPLPTSMTNPAQVGFSPDGDFLVVTQRGSSSILSIPVMPDGTLGTATESPSSGAVPFGFAFDKRAHLLVAEAAGSALSSYSLDEDMGGRLNSISPSVADLQRSACWVAVTPNGHFAYVANTAANTISGYRVRYDGRLSLLSPDGLSAAMPAGSLPADVAVGRHGKALYVFDRGVGEVAEFRIESSGKLTPGSSIRGLPSGATGLAAN